MEDIKHPLLTSREEDQTNNDQSQSLPLSSNHSFASSFAPDADDIQPINGVRDFFREFQTEVKKLWYLAGPAIFTSICQYSLGAITQLGMGSALETLCGQAFGAGQVDMLGIYMQRSWVILNTTAALLSLLYIFAYPFLELIGQTAEISKAAGVFSVWMIPQLFAYAMNFPIAKFLQSQSKIMVMALISVVALILHTVFSWLLMLKLGWGLVGAAVVLNGSWWFIVIAQLLYIFSGTCGRAWSGFSWQAFQNLWGFVRLSLASAVMLCLEVWYFMALILFAGYLKNAEVSVDALSICMNILGWTIMVALGMNAAISVRVSNELGAAHPRTAKFSLVVAVITSFIIGVLLSLILIIWRGVAIGAGWQAVVAYVNIACYYVFGIPLGLIMGYLLNMGVQGIWIGMLSGTVVQTCVLFWMVYKTNWNKEASIAEDRIRKWGGHKDSKQNDAEN
ncbi:hypothetical protein FEM48_Zijuj10G0051400 [Ziziphus jujuba var. spinosa]|uniref:Protein DETOXIFICATION n=1 Tax=Ziziphus jujuba var. spinosa TaxID=714518 RepID=A0A978ULG9_ZIZJJ|nr:hypothetical protein FEM48_Zijuj10G0051400 [Ziziphus jujuba var. spinosa]